MPALLYDSEDNDDNAKDCSRASASAAATATTTTATTTTTTATTTTTSSSTATTTTTSLSAPGATPVAEHVHLSRLIDLPTCVVLEAAEPFRS